MFAFHNFKGDLRELEIWEHMYCSFFWKKGTRDCFNEAINMERVVKHPWVFRVMKVMDIVPLYMHCKEIRYDFRKQRWNFSHNPKN